MLLGFLDRANTFFGRSFAIAALFPSMLFFVLTLTAAATAVGFDASLNWLTEQNDIMKLSLGGGAVALVLVIAIASRSLSHTNLTLWASAGGIKEPFRSIHRRRRAGLVAQRSTPSFLWTGAENKLRAAIDKAKEAAPTGTSQPANMQTPPSGEQQKKEIEKCIELLELSAHRFAPLEEVHRCYDNASNLLQTACTQLDSGFIDRMYQRIRLVAIDQEQREISEISKAMTKLSLHYGPFATLRPTLLGNIFEALDDYPSTRYHMEGSLFWPHIVQFIKPPLEGEIQDQRSFLDFSLTMASFTILYAAILLISGALLHVSLWVAISILIACFLSSYGFYRLAVSAALSLSKNLRAACDLYRHDLLTALDIATPFTLSDERQIWYNLSQHLIYEEANKPIFFENPKRPPR